MYKQNIERKWSMSKNGYNINIHTKISTTIILQSITRLKNMYKDDWSNQGNPNNTVHTANNNNYANQ